MQVALLTLRRVQNTHLWDYYCMRRARMQRMNGGAAVDEACVWHGTSGDSLGCRAVVQIAASTHTSYRHTIVSRDACFKFASVEPRH